MSPSSNPYERKYICRATLLWTTLIRAFSAFGLPGHMLGPTREHQLPGPHSRQHARVHHAAHTRIHAYSLLKISPSPIGTNHPPTCKPSALPKLHASLSYTTTMTPSHKRPHKRDSTIFIHQRLGSRGPSSDARGSQTSQGSQDAQDDQDRVGSAGRTTGGAHADTLGEGLVADRTGTGIVVGQGGKEVKSAWMQVRRTRGIGAECCRVALGV